MAIRNEFEETVSGSPPEGWSLGHVTLTLKYPDERIPVEAWRRGAFAVHERTKKDWRLTHVPTGLHIWTAPTADVAAEFAEAIEPLADWDAIKTMMPAGSDLYPKVRAVMENFETRGEPPAQQHIGR